MAQQVSINLAGGGDAVAGAGPTWVISMSGAWQVGDEFVLNVITPATNYSLGSGYLTDADITSCITYIDRVHAVGGSKWFLSDNGDATGFEQQNFGAAFVDVSNQTSADEALLGLAPYQGKIMLFSRRTSQIWNINADPNYLQLVQVFPNIGGLSGLGAQALGELDVLFPTDTGVRSLRVRDSSLNAIVSDTGSPVDELLQDAFLTTVNGGMCAVVEPQQNRYWLWVPNGDNSSGNYYTLSYYPSNKIVAWSMYDATYAAVGGAQTQFVPRSHVVYGGQVYVNCNDAIYVYGGADNNTYDGVVATLQVPFFDMKHAGHNKFAVGIDCDVNGSWDVKCSPDWINGTLEDVQNVSKATFDQNWIPYSDQGTHFTMQAQTTGNVTAQVNSLIFYYQLGDSPA